MAQVPPRFYNQQIQQQRDNYQQTKKNYYRAGSSGMSQEHQGSASQVREIIFFTPSSRPDEHFAPCKHFAPQNIFVLLNTFCSLLHFASQLTLPRSNVYKKYLKKIFDNFGVEIF